MVPPVLRVLWVVKESPETLVTGGHPVVPDPEG